MRGIALLLIAGLFAGFIYLVYQNDPTVQHGQALFQVQGTPKPGVYALILGALDAQSTAAAANAQAYSAGQTANQLYAASTAQAIEYARQQEDQNLRLTAAAAQITEQAGATTTAQAWALVEWTATAASNRATAEASQTAIAAQYTQIAIEQDIRSTQVAADYLANTLRRAQERDEATNQFLAWAPYLVSSLAIVAVIGLIIIGAIKYYRTPVVIQRDQRGDIGAMVGNNGVVWDLDRVIGGVLQLDQRGVNAPLLAAPDAQERHTARDQAVDLATRGLPGQMPQLQRGSRSASAPRMPGTPNYKIYVEPEQPPQLVADSALMNILETQWREVK
jgi:hypothetical protein